MALITVAAMYRGKHYFVDVVDFDENSILRKIGRENDDGKEIEESEVEILGTTGLPYCPQRFEELEYICLILGRQPKCIQDDVVEVYRHFEDWEMLEFKGQHMMFIEGVRNVCDLGAYLMRLDGYDIHEDRYEKIGRTFLEEREGFFTDKGFYGLNFECLRSYSRKETGNTYFLYKNDGDEIAVRNYYEGRFVSVRDVGEKDSDYLDWIPYMYYKTVKGEKELAKYLFLGGWSVEEIFRSYDVLINRSELKR